MHEYFKSHFNKVDIWCPIIAKRIVSSPITIIFSLYTWGLQKNGYLLCCFSLTDTIKLTRARAIAAPHGSVLAAVQTPHGLWLTRRAQQQASYSAMMRVAKEHKENATRSVEQQPPLFSMCLLFPVCTQTRSSHNSTFLWLQRVSSVLGHVYIVSC